MNKLFLKNAVIYTMNDKYPEAENIYIEDGIIKKIDVDINELPKETEIIDMKGRCLLPGFHDSHLHMLNTGSNLIEAVDLKKAKSIEEIIELTKRHIEKNKIPEGNWVLGFNWNHEKLKEKRMPNKNDLDKISTEHYIFLKRVCIHIASVNSRVLETYLTDKNWKTNKNIGKDKNNNPDGLIYEETINEFLEKKPSYTVVELENIIEKTLKLIGAKGLTSIQTDDMNFFSKNIDRLNTLQAFQNLYQKGKLSIRIFEQLQISEFSTLRLLLEKKKEMIESGFLSIKTVKVLLDGSLGGWTAALNHPYADAPDKTGMLNFTNEQLYEICDYCYSQKMQIACHAIGDRAIDQILNIIEKIKVKYNGIDLRPRIVHCQLPSYAQIQKIKKLGVIVDIQPMFVPSDYELVEKRIDKKYRNNIYPWKTLLKIGISLSGSSDSPVEDFAPLTGIRAAVERTTIKEKPLGGWKPYEKLTLKEAIELYTTGSAYSIGMEDVMGKIKEGYYADITVLDKDIYKTEKIEKIKIEKIIVNGKIIEKNI